MQCYDCKRFRRSIIWKQVLLESNLKKSFDILDREEIIVQCT